MKYIVCLVMMLTSVAGYSQQGGEPFTVIQHKPLSLSYNTPEELLLPQVVSNAFELRMNSSAANMKTFAHIAFANGMANNSMADKVALRLAFTNSPGAVNKSEVLMSNAPVLLFTQPGNPNVVRQQYSYIYDVVVKPFSTFMKPESYNFSIVFTVTPE
jgi:hypothetical protein